MERQALVVGINRYPHFKQKDGKKAHLEAPEKDAPEVAELLEKYGGFKVKLLPTKLQQPKNSLERKLSESAIPTREDYVYEEELKTKIEQLFNPPDNNFPDVALFYFAGHGWYNEQTKDYFLATSDTALPKQKYGLSLDWLQEQLDKSPVKQQVVWLDCCFSGGLFNKFKIGKSDEVDRCLITASRSFELAAEEEHGLLTEKLLKWLNPADKLNPWVKNYDLEEWIKRENFPPEQNPLCRNGGNKSIILTSRQSLTAVDSRLEGKCPYLSLNYFTVKDAVFFYGRKQLTKDLVKRVEQHSLIAVLGASGSGKSSLLQAGLLYELKRGQEIGGSDRWLYVEPFTPGEDPVKSLSAAEEKLKTADRRMVMIIDQFEECFTMCQDESKRQDFFKRLLAMLKQGENRLYIVIGMRSDFRPRLPEYREFAKKIDQQYVYVKDLNSEEIEEAIVEPAKHVGLQVDERLVEKIKADVKGYPNSLPLLQYTLYEMWREEGNSGFLRRETYDRLGGIEETLKKRADEVFKGVSEQDQKVAQRIFLELIQIGGTANTRRRIHLRELANSHHPLELLQQVSDKLADRDARLITKNSDEGSEDVVLDVVHEALIGQWIRLQDWKNKYKDAIVLERKIEAAAKDWENAGKKPEDPGLLLQGTRLAEAEQYLKDYGDLGMLDGVAEEYIRKSKELRKHLEKEKQARKRTLYLIGGSVSVIIIGFAIFAGNRWRKSEIGQIDALRASSESFLLSHRQLEAVNESLRTGQLLKNSFWQGFWTDAELGNRVRKTLHKVLYTVKEGNRLQMGSPINAVAFSPSDRMIATADQNGTVQIWKPDGSTIPWPHNGQQVLLTSSTNGQKKDFPVIASSADDQIVAIDYMGRLVLFFKSEDGVERIPISAVAFNPTKNILALSAGDRVVFVSLASERPLSSLEGKRGSIAALAFSRDGKTLATANTEVNEKQEKVGTVQIWNSDNGKLLKTLEGDMNNVQMSVAFSPNGQMVAASGWYGATVWKIDGTWHKTLTGQWEGVSAVTFSPDGKMIAGARDRMVKLWQIDSKLLRTKESQTLYGHSDAVWGVTFRSDSQMIASASNDNTVKLWQTDGTLVQTLNGHKGSVSAVAFSHDDKTLASASDDGAVKLWKLGGSSLKALSHDSPVYAVAFSPDRQRIITTSGHGMATLWNLDGTIIKTGKWHGGPITRVAFSRDGKIATAAGDRSVKLWQPDGTELKYLEGHTGETNQTEVLGLSFSPDGKTIATGDVAGLVQLWDTNNGKLLKTLGNHKSVIRDVSFSPNGEIIASASDDGTVTLWQRNGTPSKTLSGYEGAVVGVAVSHDGKTIASAGADKMVKLWNSEDGALLHTLSGHSGVVSAVAFSPDDRVIASASYDGTVKLWQRDGTSLKTLSGHEGAVFGVAFSDDGKTIASAGNEDRTIILWNWQENLDLKRLLEHGCARQRDYLNNNPEGKKNKDLCDRISANDRTQLDS